jgi:hypothetical protein
MSWRQPGADEPDLDIAGWEGRASSGGMSPSIIRVFPQQILILRVLGVIESSVGRFGRYRPAIRRRLPSNSEHELPLISFILDSDIEWLKNVDPIYNQ